jgi:hypothetical protein
LNQTARCALADHERMSLGTRQVWTLEPVARWLGSKIDEHFDRVLAAA